MQMSKRLEAVSAMVTSGGTVADIGTDHAYIPISLIQTGAAVHAIAMDVNQGPLERARRHIARYQLEKQIEIRLSDGLEALRPGEADSVVIAGMGGPLAIRILENGRDRLDGSELILQPQSEIRLVRAWLCQNGWEIVREDMVCEDGKFYPMMLAEHCLRQAESASAALSLHDTEEAKEADLKTVEMRLRFGPILLQERHPVLLEFLLRERKLNRRILKSLEGRNGEAAVRRMREVLRELDFVEQALAEYGDALGFSGQRQNGGVE